VLSAIKFNSKQRLVAIKIQDVATDRVLPAKLEAKIVPSQQQPEQVFRIRLMTSKRPGKV